MDSGALWTVLKNSEIKDLFKKIKLHTRKSPWPGGGANPPRPGQGDFLLGSLTFWDKNLFSKLFVSTYFSPALLPPPSPPISMTTHLLFFRCFKLCLQKPLTWWLVFLLTAMLAILPSNAISSQYELNKMGPKLSRNNMKYQQYYQL